MRQNRKERLNMNFKYFSGIKDLQELRKAYRGLVKKHHPDTGGDTKIMQEINKEYEDAFKYIEKNEYKQRETDPKDIKKYMHIIQNIVNYDFLEIEIIGSWLWVGGNSILVKDKLKELGLKWHSKKKLWFWYEGEFLKYGKKEYSIEDIRRKYGSKKIQTKEQYKISE